MDPVKAPYVEGCILVIFNKETRESATQFIESVGLKAGNWIQSIRMLVVTVPVGEEDNWICKMRSYNIVKHAELNHIHRLLGKK